MKLPAIIRVMLQAFALIVLILVSVNICVDRSSRNVAREEVANAIVVQDIDTSSRPVRDRILADTRKSKQDQER